MLVLGAPIFAYHVEGTGAVVADGTTLFQLTDDPRQAAWTPVGASVLTTLRAGLRDLLALTSVERLPGRTAPRAPRVDVPDAISDAYLYQTLTDVSPDDVVLMEEAPGSRRAQWEHWRNTRPGSFFNATSGGLGYSLPAAIGMALARPDTRVLAVIGDGSSMYSIQALWSAVQTGVTNLTVVIVNNGSYATIQQFADLLHTKPVGSDLSGIDYVGLASAMGVRAIRVSRGSELQAVLRDAVTADAPRLIEVVVTNEKLRLFS
ncbi:thiamine pyrophosphate-dependent enzyme [Kribbella sp. NPDC056861]|uniref:thiamine pyrophosphate-dependent enzyme n=1 Tax=Kribbella sp. NPDC056861 TaxID=3154857 RepID=UPI00342B6497